MNSITKTLTYIAVTLALGGCATPNKYVVLTEQWCQRHFGGECPVARYVPPAVLQPPPGPAPDLYLRNISCDDIFGAHLVTAHVSNIGDAAVPVSSASGYSVTVTVTANLKAGGMEVTQDHYNLEFSVNEDVAFRPAINHRWDQIAHVSVSADTDVFPLERNYSNNVLNTDVSPTALSSSSAFDQVYCSASQ